MTAPDSPALETSGTSTPPLWRIRLIAPEMALESFETALAPFGNVAAYTTPAEPDHDPGNEMPADVWRIEALCETEPDLSAVTLALASAAGQMGLELPEIHLDKLPGMDWLAQNRKTFPPVRAGRFFVQATFDETPVPAGSLALRLDAGPAFGSGHHATTRGCLLALDRLLNQRSWPATLDLGCGSGILALAVAARQKRPVLAVDNDSWAVRTTRANSQSNQLARFVRSHVSEGFSRIPASACFDLICANILAKPLIQLAPAVRRHLKPGGVVILAGLLAHQERAVRAAYRAQGLVLERRVVARSSDWGIWPTLVMRKGR